MAGPADIAVVGAGAAGLATALALAAEGRRVVVFGHAAPRRDGRTVALFGEAWGLLERLGIAQTLQDSAAPLSVMRLVDDTGSLFRQPPVEFRASELRLDAFGWNVENAMLVEALARAAEADPRIALSPEAVTAAAPEEDAVGLEAGSASQRVKLAVGADGRRSRMRESAGIAANEWSYPQIALTAILRHRRPHGDASTEFHTRSGPCTLVPLAGNRSSLVWLVDRREADAITTLSDEAFALRVERQVHSLLGAMTVEGPRGAVPMGGLSVSRFAAGRIALVGEAAHVFPPIGAQGLNLGLRDAAALAAAVGGSGDPGSDAVLARYDAARTSDVRLRTGAVDMLNRTLLTELLPADLLRGAGLFALSQIGPLRRFVMRQGLGPRTATPA